MNRPPKVVGLVTPWVAYADELEAKLAEANARPDYSYEDTNRLEAVTAECRSHLENLNEQEAKIDKLREEKAHQYQLARYYRTVLQEIRDKTPANCHKEWPHHHWYLCKATEAIMHQNYWRPTMSEYTQLKEQMNEIDDLNARIAELEALVQSFDAVDKARQAENDKLRGAGQDVVANRGTNIPLEASIDALAEALEADDE